MTPPIHMGLAQHPIKTGRGRGLSHMEAELVNNPSFVWHSLLEARKIIKEGAR